MSRFPCTAFQHYLFQYSYYEIIYLWIGHKALFSTLNCHILLSILARMIQQIEENFFSFLNSIATDSESFLSV